MRKPRVENKYNLKPHDICIAKVLNRERLREKPFWRNNVIDAYCLSGGSGEGFFGGFENEYWIGFYDEDAKAYAGKIKMHCTSYEGMCGYNFKTFFNPKEMENKYDLEIQEMLLETINWLIDEKIIEIPGKVIQNEHE